MIQIQEELKKQNPSHATLAQGGTEVEATGFNLTEMGGEYATA